MKLLAAIFMLDDLDEVLRIHDQHVSLTLNHDLAVGQESYDLLFFILWLHRKE